MDWLANIAENASLILRITSGGRSLNCVYDSSLSRGEKQVMLYLGHRLDFRGLKANLFRGYKVQVSVGLIARMISLCRTTVTNIIAGLVEKGYVVKSARRCLSESGRIVRDSNEYGMTEKIFVEYAKRLAVRDERKLARQSAGKDVPARSTGASKGRGFLCSNSERRKVEPSKVEQPLMSPSSSYSPSSTSSSSSSFLREASEQKNSSRVEKVVVREKEEKLRGVEKEAVLIARKLITKVQPNFFPYDDIEREGLTMLREVGIEVLRAFEGSFEGNDARLSVSSFRKAVSDYLNRSKNEQAQKNEPVVQVTPKMAIEVAKFRADRKAKGLEVKNPPAQRLTAGQVVFDGEVELACFRDRLTPTQRAGFDQTRESLTPEQFAQYCSSHVKLSSWQFKA